MMVTKPPYTHAICMKLHLSPIIDNLRIEKAPFRQMVETDHVLGLTMAGHRVAGPY